MVSICGCLCVVCASVGMCVIQSVNYPAPRKKSAIFMICISKTVFEVLIFQVGDSVDDEEGIVFVVWSVL